MKAFVEAIILLLPIAPFLNLYRNPGFLRRLSLFPRVFGVLSFCILVYLTLSILLVFSFPQYSALVITLASPLAFYLYYWRTRPTFGSDKGLPPGSLHLAPSGPWVDYLYYRKQTDIYGPIFKMNHFVQPMICLTGIQLGTEFLKHHEDSTVTPPMPFNQYIPNGFMRYMAPAVHMEYRNSMKVIFADPGFLEKRKVSLCKVIRETLCMMANGSKAINPVPHLQSMAFSIFATLFLGLSPQDPIMSRLRELYHTIDYRHALFSTKGKTEKALREIEDIFLKYALTQESYFRNFLENKASGCPGHARDKTLLRNFIFLFQTSWIDVSDLLTWMFKLLSDNPQWVNALRTDLQSEESDNIQSGYELANRIALETLRLEQSEYLMRKAIHDIRFKGFLIPKGWLVRIGIRESHRDADIFPNPHDFNPDRFLTGSYGPKQYSPFGIQQKSCVGKGLTLWIGQKFVLELARGFQWTVVQDGPRELGYFHWRPSSKLRVRMSRSSRVGQTM
jgi:cytochrome P450